MGYYLTKDSISSGSPLTWAERWGLGHTLTGGDSRYCISQRKKEVQYSHGLYSGGPLYPPVLKGSSSTSECHGLIKVWNPRNSHTMHKMLLRRLYKRPREHKKCHKMQIRLHHPGREKQRYSHYRNVPYTTWVFSHLVPRLFHSLTFLTVHNPCNKIQCSQYNNKQQQGFSIYSSKSFSLACDQSLKNMLFCSWFCHISFCM